MGQLFFDFDGTIADSEVGIVNSIKYFVNKLGLRPLSDDQYRLFIGPALTTSLHQYYPELDDAAVQKAIETYQEFYTKDGIFQLQLYPGIEATLAQLQTQGYTLNIASAKPEVMIHEIMQHFDLGHYFTGQYGATLDERIRSTKTQVLAYALQESHADSSSLMIGDRETDIVGGQHNGLRTIGVTYGFGDLAELQAANATEIVATPAAIVTGVDKLM